MKLAVVGCRKFNNYEFLEETILEHYPIEKIDTIISGGAKGTDTLAEQFAKKHNLTLIIFAPNWEKYGKSAGPVRNQLIVKECNEMIAFWDGVSRGTLSSINLAKKSRKPVMIIDIND